MDQNQTPTPQPDYSFIVNQGLPNGEVPGEPKKRNKKVIVLIVLLVITAMVVGLAIFLPEKQQGQQQANTETVVENNEPRTDQEAAVRQYLNNMTDGQYSEAYKSVASNAVFGEQTAVTEEWFTQFFAPAVTPTWSFSPCTVFTPDETNPDTVESLCLSQNGQLTIATEFQIVKNNDVYLITSSQGIEVREL